MNMKRSEKSNAMGRWFSKRNKFVAPWFLSCILVVCTGCGAPEPEKPACPTVFPGTETFACNQTRITGLALAKDDVFWANRTGALMAKICS